MSQKQEQERIILWTANRWRRCLGSGWGGHKINVVSCGNGVTMVGALLLAFAVLLLAYGLIAAHI